MTSVKQVFPASPDIDVQAAVRQQLTHLSSPPKPGSSIAIGVGSRGITKYHDMVNAVVDYFRSIGAKPFLLPAMGSHGGATPKGQTQVLADYGITESSMGVPIRSDMESSRIGKTESGFDLWVSRVAQQADHIFVINRIKPHTDFVGKLGSGCLKMLTVGTGKREGAANFHQCAVRHGYENVLREISLALLGELPVLGGLAIVEDQHHQSAAIELLQATSWIAREEALHIQAASLMPRIPFEDLDLLIVDRIGKNISGTGMDTTIIGRGVHGYTTLVGKQQTSPPHIKRIYVRGLTAETHGNAIGIGMADFTHLNLVDQINHSATRLNSLTSLTPHSAKIPIACATDEEAIDLALISAGVTDPVAARVVRIPDTLNLESIFISKALARETTANDTLQIQSDTQGPLLSSLTK